MLDFLNESLKGRCLFAIPKKGKLFPRSSSHSSIATSLTDPLDTQGDCMRNVFSFSQVRRRRTPDNPVLEAALTLASGRCAGADIQFTRSHRLDVCLVRNHNMALYVGSRKALLLPVQLGIP